MSIPSNDLVFEVFCPNHEWPEIDYPRGQELSVFFPKGRPAVQVNYGQGEGQVLIDGLEWGFYYNERGNLDVVLHGAGISPSQASGVVSDICQALETRYKIQFAFRVTAHPAASRPS